MITFAILQSTEEWQKYAVPAKDFYSDELPYHNWGHGLEIAAEVVNLGNRCIARGLRIDIGLLAVAAAWHDAGFHENHQKFGAPTKEAYSYQLAEAFLLSAGKSKVYVREVEKAIMGTEHKALRRGINMYALHRADVASIGGPYDHFAHNSAKLLLEGRIFNPQLTFSGFVNGSTKFIQDIIADSPKELALLGEPWKGEDSFPAQAERNIERLADETEESLLQYAA